MAQTCAVQIKAWPAPELCVLESPWGVSQQPPCCKLEPSLCCTVQAIHGHTSSLQAWTYSAMARLEHSNGRPMTQLFGRHDDPSKQSCIFEFLVLQPDGSAMSQVVVEEAAFNAGLAIRTGCMCNPGQCQFNLGILPEEVSHLNTTQPVLLALAVYIHIGAHTVTSPFCEGVMVSRHQLRWSLHGHTWIRTQSRAGLQK